jgi:hypothetical protein
VFIKSSNEVTDTFTWWFSRLLVELIANNVNIEAGVGWEQQSDVKPPLSAPVPVRKWSEYNSWLR